MSIENTQQMSEDELQRRRRGVLQLAQQMGGNAALAAALTEAVAQDRAERAGRALFANADRTAAARTVALAPSVPLRMEDAGGRVPAPTPARPASPPLLPLSERVRLRTELTAKLQAEGMTFDAAHAKAGSQLLASGVLHLESKVLGTPAPGVGPAAAARPVLASIDACVGRNRTEKAMAYLRAQPGGDRLGFNELHEQAALLLRGAK